MFLCCFLAAAACFAQPDEIPKEQIPTLVRIAEEYDFWKWVFSVITVVLAVWSYFGLKLFIKTNAEEWVLAKIAKEADLNVVHVKSAVREFAHIAELKKKPILVVSAGEGQQQNVKKVLDACGFTHYDWKSIGDVPTLVIQNTSVILLNDQLDSPLTEAQLESVMDKFKANVGYCYFGDKRIKSDEYRQRWKISLDFSNSDTSLEAALIRILKIV